MDVKFVLSNTSLYVVKHPARQRHNKEAFDVARVNFQYVVAFMTGGDHKWEPNQQWVGGTFAMDKELLVTSLRKGISKLIKGLGFVCIRASTFDCVYR